MEKVGLSSSVQARQPAEILEHGAALPVPAPDGNTKQLCDYNLQEDMSLDCAAQGGAS